MNQNPSTGQEKLLLVIVGVVGFLLVMGLLGTVANRISCGGWARPDSMFDPLRFFVTGDAAAFGTYQGCTASTGMVIGFWIGLLVTVGVIAGLCWYMWRRYTQSDLYFIRDVRRRDGIARHAEVKKSVGRGAARKKAGKVRPQMDKPKAEDAALMLGTSQYSPVWASLEESVVLIGPPRSGKGLHLLVSAILDAPGPVITTSSRADNYAMTAALRAEQGPVSLFDPQGLTGQETTLKWSPITGCEVPRVANQRAESLISASGLGGSGNNAEWKEAAATIMECLLHAAALGNKTVDELMEWGTSPVAAQKAVDILLENPSAAPGWGMNLKGVLDGDERMLQNKWFGVSGAVKGLAVPEVRQVMKPTTVEETFDIDKFIRESGTLYIVGTKTGGSTAGPFLIAMMDAITQRGREMAAKLPGNRLDPPMSLVLDEIANISGAWPGLVQLMADGGGVGISPFAVFQSMAQARNEWGQEQASALFDAATVKVQLGGASNTEDLRVFSDLAGSRQITRTSTSRQKDGTSTSDQIQDAQVLDVGELRRIPFGWGLLLNRNGRPIFMEMTKWPDRKDGKQIGEAKSAYEKALVDQGMTEQAKIDAAESVAQEQQRRANEVLFSSTQVHRTASSVEMANTYHEETGTVGEAEPTQNGLTEEQVAAQQARARFSNIPTV